MTTILDQEYPQMKTLLSRAHRCAVCGQFFLKLYMSCVEFVDAHKILSTSNGTGVIPTLAFLCSYRCDRIRRQPPSRISLGPFTGPTSLQPLFMPLRRSTHLNRTDPHFYHHSFVPRCLRCFTAPGRNFFSAEAVVQD